MPRIYARSLAGKEIVTVEGMVLGELENIILDVGTGKLIDLVVDPNPSIPKGRYRGEGNFILIPFDAVCAMKDDIVVDGIRAQK